MSDDGRRGRVLVVDPDGDARAALAECLEQAGFSVEAEAGTDRAWVAFQHRPPDVIVIAQSLHPLEDFVFLRHVQEATRGATARRPRLLAHTPAPLSPDRREKARAMLRVDGYLAGAPSAEAIAAWVTGELTDGPALPSDAPARHLEIKCSGWVGLKNLYVRNVSRGGMFVRTAEPPPPATPLLVHFALPDHPRLFTLPARVTHVFDASSSVGQHGMAVKFSLSRQAMAEIERHLAEHTPVRVAQGTLNRQRPRRITQDLVSGTATPQEETLIVSLDENDLHYEE